MQILIAVGKSKHSQLALQQCVLLAQKLSVSATVLTVIKDNQDEASTVSILEKAVQVLETAVTNPQAKIRRGDASEQIIQEVLSHPYDLLIIGERAHHNLLTRLWGPTALRIVAQLPCPVLVTKNEANPFKQILVCDSVFVKPSLSERFSKQFPELVSLADSVNILHVMSQIAAAPGVKGKQLRADANELMNTHSPEGTILTQDRQLLRTAEGIAEPVVRHGLVVDEILAEAINGRYDLIVIGAHPQAGWQRFLLEDVTAQIILQADRPVLVIP